MTIQQLMVGNETLISFSFVASNTTTNNNSVTVPSTAQPGDIAIIADNVDTISANPGAPTNWTEIRHDFSSGNIGLGTYYKVLTESDINASVASQNTSTTDHFMLCAVFRPSSFIGTLTVGGQAGSATTANPASITLSISGIAVPLIGFVVFAQRGSNNANFSIAVTPTNSGSVTTLDESSRNVLRLYYLFYAAGTTPANTSADLNDNGAQAQQCWYIRFT